MYPYHRAATAQAQGGLKRRGQEVPLDAERKAIPKPSCSSQTVAQALALFFA